MTTYYTILIRTNPQAQYQSYRGWDQVYTERREAMAARKAAAEQHYAVKLVTADHDKAVRLGWLAG